MYNRGMFKRRKSLSLILSLVLVLFAMPLSASAEEEMAAPAITKITGTGSSSLTVHWKADKSDAAGFEINYSKNKSMKNAHVIKIKDASARDKKITKLSPYTAYYIQIRALGDGIKSEWSPQKKIRTKKAGRKYLNKQIRKVSSKSALTTFNSRYKINKTDAGKELGSYLKKLKKKYQVSIIAIDLYTGEGFSSSARTKIYSASCLKGAYVAAMNKYEPGKASKYRNLQKKTIVQSKNNAYAKLWGAFGTKSIRKYCKRAGTTTYKGNEMYKVIVPEDLAKLWVENYWYFFRDTNKNSKKTRKLYTHGKHAFIEHALSQTVYTKSGWMPYPGKHIHNDAGIVMSKVNGKTRPYILVVTSKSWKHEKELKKLVRLADKVHTDMID